MSALIAVVRLRSGLLRTTALLLLVALAGCTGDRSDLREYIAEVKAKDGPPLEPLPVMQQFETFEYVPQEIVDGEQVLRRDPFSLPREKRVGTNDGPRPDPDRRRELLETIPLDGLSMVGTLGPPSDLIALVIDPDRVVHRVKVGNYMGQNEGRIVRIAEDRIDLIELEPDGTGSWRERQASVALD